MQLNLHTFLSDFRGRQVTFIPNPGNAGDAVLNTAAYQLFDANGIDYVTRCSLEEVEETDGGCVFYGGGGNLVGYYLGAFAYLQLVLPRCERLVILPHTVRCNYKFLHSLPAKVDIICRDLPSFRHVSSLCSGRARVHLCHDLAFFLDYSPWLNEPQSATASKVGNFFREDAERTAQDLPPDNVDISKELQGPHPSSSSAKSYFHHVCGQFIQRLAHHTEINTNRLHVAIVAANLGKRVNLYPNRYWKNKAVFSFSLRNRYPNVRFHERPFRHGDDAQESLSDQLGRLMEAGITASNRFDPQSLLALARAAWNYAITNQYELVEDVFKQPRSNEANRCIDLTFAELVERKQLLYPDEMTLIARCHYTQNSNGELSLNVEPTNVN